MTTTTTVQAAFDALAKAVQTGSPVGTADALAMVAAARDAAGVSAPVPVESWRVTAAMLAEWGFPIEKRGHIVGAGFIEQAGWRWNVAKHAAWCAGFTRLTATPDWVTAQVHADFEATLAEQRVNAAESLAWFQANNLISRSATV